MPAPHSPPLLACFPPVIDDQTEILILGSFPGEASLQVQQYYAHPRNQFWRLLSAVLNDDLLTLPYQNRLARLQAHRIGLWDVIGACEREGSLDSAIRNARANNFQMLKTRCPALRRVAFNGKTAGRHAASFAEAGFQTIVLPSSSPAHAAMSYEKKLAAWRSVLH
ncbi:MAG TPA: DNA-deoxyinosine glycosylase [Oxalicibacterium sp.]|nr:DNA-deoxyinosine glycosylase [Oxalicibacterium sp.]